MTDAARIKELEAENQRLKQQLAQVNTWASLAYEINVPIVRIDANDQLIEANPAFTRLLAETKHKLKRPLSDYLATLRRFSERSSGIYTTIKLNGEYYWPGIVNRNADGHCAIVLREVTAVTRLRQELKATLIRLESLISNLQDALLVEDEQRQIVLTNEAFCQVFRIPAPPHALRGADCSRAAEQSKDLFADPEQFVGRVNQVLAARQTVLSEMLEMADGRILERDYIPVWAGPKYLGHMWRYRDITLAENQRRSLSQSEEKYRTLIENMNLGLLEVDNKDYIQYANQSLQHMTGYSVQELLGNRAADLLTDGTVHELLLEKAALRQEGQMDVYEIPCRRKDGRQIWFLVSGAPRYNAKGDVVGSIGIHLDITHRKRLEEDLKTAKVAAEASSEAKELFMANMSHEIRTPMNAIIGMQRLLAKTTLEDRQRRYVDAIGISASNLLVLINDVLDFSKLRAGKMELALAPFDLSKTVRAVANVLEYKAEEKQLAFQVSLADVLPRHVLGDGHRLYQVLMNLSGNAVKFTEKGHVLLRITPGPKAGEVTFAVEDTGIGMGQDVLERIFDPFSQADASIAREYGGTGLGLNISKQWVEAMGGTLLVESIAGQGSVFSFTIALPAAAAAQIETPTQQTGQQRLDGWLVMVVEDNEFNRLVAQTVLESAGASVVLANNGAEAVDLVSVRWPDIVLMDLQMPVLGGLDATVILRQQGYKGPVLALTANAFPEIRDRCLTAGMDDLVVKPFEEAELIAQIRRHLLPQSQETTQAQTGDASAATINVPEPNMPSEEVRFSSEKLEQLSQGNPAFVHKMLGMARTLTVTSTAEILEAAQAHDRNRIYNIAHRLKATLDMLQVVPMRTTVRELENSAREDMPADALLALAQQFAAHAETLSSLLLAAAPPEADN